MKNLPKAGHPLLLASVLLLLVNDWLLKPAFHNDLTGKLSDFAGLFALPYLLGVLFPRRPGRAHVLIAVAFVVWKSSFSQPLIEFINSLGIGVGRTVDATDNVALLSVGLSYLALHQEFHLLLMPLAQRALLVAAGAACLADTLPPRYKRKFMGINKSYSFDFSKRELVARFNQAQLEAVRKWDTGTGAVDFDAEHNIFYWSGFVVLRDAAGAYYRHYPKSRRDTLAILLDYTKLSNQDTISYHSSMAEIKLVGDSVHSTLTLLSLYRANMRLNNKDYRALAIKEFEKELIKPMRKKSQRYHKHDRRASEYGEWYMKQDFR